MPLPLLPPIDPMLAKAVSGVPSQPDGVPAFSYEPKWDGFRAIVWADGTVTAAADDLLFPNGSVITDDGSTLIVGESMGARYTAFTITHDRGLTNRRIWAEVPGMAPDGCTIDAEGAIWFADALGKQVVRVREGGEITDQLPTPDNVYACMLGGPDARSGEEVADPFFGGAGPARNADWIRGGSANLTPHEMREACDASLERLHTDVLDLYQIHWPNRNVPTFGPLYFDPKKDGNFTSIHDQLAALAGLVQAGKVRHVGLSNETPWGLAEFVRLADAHGLPAIATVQNPYTLVNRVVDNGLDEMMHRYGVSLLAYSPLGFGLLTGKYDEVGLTGAGANDRLTRFEAFRKQRWCRPEVLDAARKYNALARAHGLTPTQMALAFCYTNWRVASTIIGANTVAQLDENLDAWGTTLSPELLVQIDAIRWAIRDPAQ